MSPHEILLIEDNPISRKAVRATLETEGYRITEAGDGETALKLMARRLPDLVLLDLVLPDISGFELVSRLRAVPGAAKTPILALTGLMTQADEKRIGDAPFNDYLFKPVEPALLVSTLHTYLASAEPALRETFKNRRVLVVDDEPTQLKLFATYLRQLGFEVATASNGYQGLTQARSHRPDAIASDVLMPGMDGFELCMNVRADPLLKTIPVVLMSNNYAQEADRQLAKKIGAAALVEITPDFHNVIEALQNLRGAPSAAIEDTGSVQAAHQERLSHQLDRHVKLSAQLARRCATQSAQISVLARIGEDFLKGKTDTQGLLDDLLAQYLDAIGFSCGAIYLEDSEKELLLSAQIGFGQQVAESLPTFFGHQDILREATLREEPLAISSTPERDGPFVPLLAQLRADSLLISPLRFGREVLGVIVLTSHTAQLSSDWLTFSKAVTNQIAQAIALNRALSQLRYLASYDALTGLSNRAYLRDRLQEAIDNKGRPSALYLLNVHRFEEINNTLSYPNGNRLLQEIAKRLRETCDDRGVITRLGADEFAVLLPDASVTAAVHEAAADILNSLKPAFVLNGLPIIIRATMGIVLIPNGTADADNLLSCADMAQRAARRTGHDYLIYPSHVEPYRPERLTLLGELRDALQHDKLLLHYQPKVNLKTALITGVEALLRWPHSSRGWIAPDQFIPLAEKAGLIHSLTLWVLTTALEQASRWKRDGFDLDVAINISARDLEVDAFPAYITQVCDFTGIAHSDVTLEITERDLVVDPVSVEVAMRRLSATGIRFAIDDFGTGYSSFSYLQTLPVSEIKIDKSFVSDLNDEARGAAIVRSIIDLGRNLNLAIVAEGIENQETWNALAAMRCDLGQGYHICRPVAPEPLIEWLKHPPLQPPRVSQEGRR